MPIVHFLSLLPLLEANAWAACPYPTPDFTVCASSCTHTTIQAAVNAAAAGDTICVAPGTYNGALSIPRSVSIGADAPGVNISNTVSGTEVISVTGGGTIELNGVDVVGNASRRCVNVAANTDLVLVGGSVSGCSSSGLWPGIYLAAGSVLDATGTTFDNDGNSTNDGGVVYGDNAASVSFDSCTFSNNIAQDGGVAYLNSTPATFTDCTFETNLGTGNGGVVWSNDNTTVTRGTFLDNDATGSGGAMYLDAGTLSVSGVTFDGNASGGSGAALVYSGTGTATVTSSLFDGNIAQGDGGAIQHDSGTLVVEACDFFSNQSDNGGALATDSGSPFTVRRSDFWNNQASVDGGAVHLQGSGTKTLRGNTFATNTATGNGGALRSSSCDATVQNNVFVDNDGASGDGIYHSGGNNDDLFLVNNILSHHGTAARQQSGDILSDYNSWFSNTTDVSGFSKGTGELSANPTYVAFSNNNTNDDNLLVALGSPCIDTGDPGITDPDGTRSDIGIGGGPESRDRDKDRVGSPEDCDDNDANRFPGNPELVGNGVDNDCDGQELCYADADDDTYGDPGNIQSSTDVSCTDPGLTTDGSDCDDVTALVNPGMPELVDDNIDQDCDGNDACFQDADLDGRGSASLVDAADFDCVDPGESTVSTDCDDADPARYPGNTEITADGIDQDCDGLERCWVDGDRDSYGASTTTTSTFLLCPTNQGLANDATDCNDLVSTINPGATETVADGVDQNCDGGDRCYRDSDADTYGVAGMFTNSSDLDCTDTSEANRTGDCNDAAATIFPGAAEVPADGVDQDCDSRDHCFRDQDSDGFAGTNATASNDMDCTDPNEFATSTDCNDGNNAIRPGATEIVGDGIDQNCLLGDGCYRDQDDDNFGTTTVFDSTDLDCTDANEATNSTDCNDASAAIRPNATEQPADGTDQNCDGLEACYLDTDGDLYGGSTTGTSAVFTCLAAGYAPNANDCDDTRATVNPGEVELTGNNRDDNCDGLSRCFVDGDRDGYGDTATVDSTNATCTSGEGESTNNDDCDDARGSTNPGATEVKENGFDDDCDGFDLVDCLVDADDDEYGVEPPVTAEFEADCLALAGYTADAPANRGDCDDGDDTIHPGAPDVLGDGIDSNCDGVLDEDGDGLAFPEEFAQGSSDGDPDTDDDGLTDLQEYLSCRTTVPVRTDCLDPTSPDSDGDTLTDLSEYGRDTDGDGLQDGLDEDDDGDGVPTLTEVAVVPFDYDGDGLDNVVDPDDDGDGVDTIDEDVGGDGDPRNDDTDRDGTADWLDRDDDGDGVDTADEIVVESDPLNPDSDEDSVPDGVEWPDPTRLPPDNDNDGTADILDPDDDGDGIDTLIEELELAPDGDGIPNYLDDDSDDDGTSDLVEMSTDTDPPGNAQDEDSDGIPDFVDLFDADGGAGDGDQDGIANADEQDLGSRPNDPDSDDDLLIDGWEVDAGPAHRDTDGDGTPDVLDDDDDGDGVPTHLETGFLDRAVAPDLCDPVSCDLRCADARYNLNPDLVLICDGDVEAAPTLADLRDTDGDGIPDIFDEDDDGDGVDTKDEPAGDLDEDCVSDAFDTNAEDGPGGDFDADGLANDEECAAGLDPYDGDTDGDGVLDGWEASEGDTDGDSVDDVLDDDDDGDGVPTRDEGRGDTDDDGIPDYLDPDSDGDGVPDGAESLDDGDCDGTPDRLDGAQGRCAVASTAATYRRQGCEQVPGLPAGVPGLALVALVALRRRAAR
jgi:hypothetical protein